jgi:hypothetical protein
VELVGCEDMGLKVKALEDRPAALGLAIERLMLRTSRAPSADW